MPLFINSNEADSLHVVFNIRIGANGKLLRMKIKSASNNPDYDDAVEARVKSIESFGAPPPQLRKEVDKVGLDINMCPKKCPNKG